MNHHPDIFAAPEKFDPDRWYVFVLLLLRDLPRFVHLGRARAVAFEIHLIT